MSAVLSAPLALAALNDDGAGVPEWVHLLPLGRIEGRDGRQWTNDNPQAVCADFAARAVDLPVDYEHQADRPPSGAGPVPAAGWIKALKVAANGIWGEA